jgi:MFS family permease
VVRLQHEAEREEYEQPAAVAVPGVPPPQPLRIRRDDGGDAAGAIAKAAPEVMRLRKRVLRAQTWCGVGLWLWLLYAMTLVTDNGKDAELGASTVPTPEAASAAAAPDAPLLIALGIALVLLLVIVGPPLAATLLQRGVSRRAMLFSLASIFGVVLAAALFSRLRADSMEMLLGLGLFVISVAAIGTLLGAFLSTSLRGAAPPLMAAMAVTVAVLVGIAGATELATSVFMDPDDDPTTAGDWLATALYLLVALAAGAVLSWINLQHIARRYQRKEFSEQQLALEAYWGVVTLLMIAVVGALGLEDAVDDAGARAAAAMLGGLVVYLVILRFWLGRIVRSRAPSLPPMLLLRVFRAPADSELFMDRLLSLWRFGGPLWMIGGPDLAGANMEPHEFFAFVRRRLGDLFLRRRRDVDARLQQLDDLRDPDGRFRVNELFCLGNCWKDTVTALMGRAGLVLLDLRGYEERRTGMRYEIEQVINSVPLQRCVVLTQAGDDEVAIDAVLRSAWSQMQADSPNRVPGGAELRVVQLKGNGMREVNRVFADLARVVRAGAASSHEDVGQTAAAPATSSLL